MTVKDDREAIAAVLKDLGFYSPLSRIRLAVLGGGVSCDVWRVECDNRTVCVKRALPKLRVEADWHAPAERAASEVAWLRLVSTIEPKWVPRVLGEDRTRHLFVMEYFPPKTHPIWKSELARGAIDGAFATKVGVAIARIHAETAGRADIASDFANAAQFNALRLEPYLLHTASRHPGVADTIRKTAASIGDARIALMHGDVSPKNILCGPDGPVFLDAETACYGDPAFDLAFCLNHLLLKCVWQPQWTSAYLDSFSALKTSYLANVNWEDAPALEARAARLLPALLLARIDGKSPVEYLTGEQDKAVVRQVASALLHKNLGGLDEISSYFARNVL